MYSSELDQSKTTRSQRDWVGKSGTKLKTFFTIFKDLAIHVFDARAIFTIQINIIEKKSGYNSGLPVPRARFCWAPRVSTQEITYVSPQWFVECLAASEIRLSYKLLQNKLFENYSVLTFMQHTALE